MADRDNLPEEPRRDWVASVLARLSRQPADAEATTSEPRFTPLLIVAVLVLAAAAGLTIGLILTAGDDDAELEGTRMTLELAYPIAGEPSANLEGQPEAAPPGARITCRATSDQSRLGEGRANDDGSFDIALDADHWPLDSLTGDTYDTLNATLECRAGAGPWVEPLRPPRVAIN